MGLGIRRDFWEALALHFYGYTWLVLLYSCVLLIAVTEKQGLVTRVTKIRPLGALAVITFGVHLLHMPIGMSFRWLILGQLQVLQTWRPILVVAFCALLITLTLASISWIFFEKRIVKLEPLLQIRRCHQLNHHICHHS